MHLAEKSRTAGFLELERARVRWFLSVDVADLPSSPEPGGPLTYRSMTVDGSEVEFSTGFTDLHTRVYEATLAGEGCGLDDARPSIEVVHGIREAAPVPGGERAHPFVERAQATTPARS